MSDPSPFLDRETFGGAAILVLVIGIMIGQLFVRSEED
jgi:uncharacterized membrane-anchored protein YhcB (DUF1043 family)